MKDVPDCDLKVEQEESIAKKLRSSDYEVVEQPKIIVKSDKVKTERCKICKQYIDQVTLYNGHPNNAVDEFIVLADEKLSLFTGDEADLNEQDLRPTNKITHFTVYDVNGHLCPFDTGLIEQNLELFFSGYVKPIYDENPLTDNGIPTKDMGPINEWYMSGFDGGEKANITFVTAFGEYYLMDASPNYRPLMNVVCQKIALSKLVIEFLLDEAWQNPTYEDLLQKLATTQDLTEEVLLRHSQFICDQVVSFDRASDGDETPLISSPCMRALIKLAGVTFQKRHNFTKIGTKWQPYSELLLQLLQAGKTGAGDDVKITWSDYPF